MNFYFYVPIIAAFIPFILLPIERIIPYPEIIEEIAILLMMIPLIKLQNNALAYKIAICAGILFSISELVLYLFNIALVGTAETLFQRLLFTTLLHVSTALVILYFGRKNRLLLVVGFLLAVGIHSIYNRLLF